MSDEREDDYGAAMAAVAGVALLVIIVAVIVLIAQHACDYGC